MPSSLLIADASTLLNFLSTRRFDLVEELGYRVRIVDAVYDEVQSEREHLEELVEDGRLRLLTLEGMAITDTVARFLAEGLGAGESFSCAAAVEFEGAIAIDDRRAIKHASKLAPTVAVLTSKDIVVAGIHANRLSVAEADVLKAEWAEKHRFKLKFASFGEFIGAKP